MKLADYVIDYLQARGTRHVFGMSGGAAVHLFDAAKRHPGLGTTFVTHEQSAAIAADGYYRVSGRMGACVVTSGPETPSLRHSGSRGATRCRDALPLVGAALGRD